MLRPMIRHKKNEQITVASITWFVNNLKNNYMKAYNSFDWYWHQYDLKITLDRFAQMNGFDRCFYKIIVTKLNKRQRLTWGVHFYPWRQSGEEEEEEQKKWEHATMHFIDIFYQMEVGKPTQKLLFTHEYLICVLKTR